jgi:peptide/nickel transport system substrate-binding protein
MTRFLPFVAPRHPSRRAFLRGTAAAGLVVAGGAVRWPGSSRADETPKAGGRLTVAADTEPRNLNPAIVASNGVFYVASKVIEPLAEMADGGGLRPLLATGWEGSADGKTITFKLRPGVEWHDGKPFTSEDVAFSAIEVWKKLQNLGQALYRNLEAVDTPDATTAVFRFAKPTPLQLIENALPATTAVLPKHLYAGTDIAKNPHNETLVGTGPFRYAEHKPGEYYRLARNPTYWDKGKPYLDEIVFRVLPDPGAITAALEAKEIQLAAFSAVPLSDLGRIGAIPGLSVVTRGYDGITYQITVEINHRRKELADVRVRQALRHAIDSKFVVDTVFLGHAEAATGPVPATAKQFYTADVPTFPFDPAKANALLDEAGLKRGGDGTRFSVKLLPAPWFQETRQTGDYVRQALKAVGIDAELVNNDPGAHIKAVYTDHAFDLAIGSPVWRNDPAISTTILFQGGLPAGVPFSNQYGYDDPAMDKIIADALVTIDPAARVDLYKKFQQLAGQQQPLLNIADFTFTSVASTSVQNIGNNPRWATSSWSDTWIKA